MLSFLYSPTLTSIHDYGKTIALTKRTFVEKVMSMLSRLVLTFLPRNKSLLISWLQSPSAVILELRRVQNSADMTGKGTSGPITPHPCGPSQEPPAVL